MNIKFGVDIYAPEEVNELARASIGYIESDDGHKGAVYNVRFPPV